MASDTCDIYFTHIKVNHLLYTCSLDPFEDGILLETSLVCMHRYYRNLTDDEEECKRQRTPTPSMREAWKRRRKKRSCYKLQPPDVRTPPDIRYLTQPRRPEELQATSATVAGRPKNTGRPTSPSARTTDTGRTTGATATEKNLRKSEVFRTSGPSRASGRLTPTGRPTPVCAATGLWPCIPLPLTPWWLRL